MPVKDRSFFVHIKAKLIANPYKSAFMGCSILLLLMLPILSFDAGLTDDERVHNEHGIRMLDHYLHGDTMALTNPIDPHGDWRYKTEPENFPVFMNVYGGFFDMAAAFVYRYVTSSFMGEYESKHFLIAITGAWLFILTGLITFQLTDSWAAALLALIFAAMSPRLVGHSLDNPKDIPFSASVAFGIYQILLLLKEQLRLSWKRSLLLIVSLVVALDIRIGAIMLLLYLLFFSALFILFETTVNKVSYRKYVLPFLAILAIAVAGYLGASLCWPWASRNPIMNPLISLRVFSQFSQFNSLELFEGARINNDAIPWYFIPKWYLISFPLFLYSGLLLFLVLSWLYIKLRSEKTISIALVLTAFALPLALVMIKKSNLFDDGRHLYFVLPPMLTLAAVGWYWLLKLLPRKAIWPVAGVCALTMVEPFLFMVRNHPHEVMYFSPISGGVKGAFKNYEMDYWGFSIKAAVNWLDNTDSVQAKNRKTKVRLWYGEQLKLKYYADKSMHLEYVLAGVGSPDWDYYLMLPAESKYNPDLLKNWPPANTIHQITVDDVPLCAIIRNPLSDINGPVNSDPVALIPADDHMTRGLAFYNTKDYNHAILEFKALIKADSSNQGAYNNLVAAYNLLNMYKDAVEIGSYAMKRFPEFELLRNNLAYSKDGLSKLKIDEKYLLAISYNYFVQMNYAGSISASKEILRKNPTCVAAYNNLCASYNALGDYKAGEAACLKGLELAPSEQLLKNNLAVAQKAKGDAR